MEHASLFDFESKKEEKVLTVTEINTRLKQVIKGIPEFKSCWVEGEISGYKKPLKHCYFTLKDKNQYELSAVIWSSRLNAEMLKLLANGNAVEAHGDISVYEQGGKYQLYVDRLRPRGIGKFFEELERLKRQLEAEGLCAQERKRPLPKMPRTIGIVSSPSAAGYKDMLSVFRSRWSLAELTLAPATVQGASAPASIIAALRKLYAIKPDVIILARGGGSMEDLWCFNNEQVARTVAASPVPIITGVGHDIDTTLVDYVSDYRALTPTDAATQAVPDRTQVLDSVTRLTDDLDDVMDRILNNKTQSFEMLERRLALQSPQNRVGSEKKSLEQMTVRLDNAERTYTARLNDMLSSLTKRLELLDPSNVMRRGYAFVRKEETVITSAHELSAGDRVAIRFYDGEKTALVD